ncbi:MAG: hypothetical protein C0524_14810 [Rhodobacter sp.]|nr:hypothetical protein [Rhodobacter sp.]
MRLVCPNCDAKYEVPDDAIPDTGRDVQCANCSHSWFQMRPRSASAAPVATGAAAPVAEAEAEVAAKAEPEVKAEVAETPEVEAVPKAPEIVVEASKAATVDEPDTKEATSEEVPAQPAAEPAPEVVEVADLEPEPVPEPDLAPEPEAAEGEDDEPATATAPAAYLVDGGVLAILREEAEREALARRSEASPLEIQTTLGMEAAASAKKRPVAVPLGTETDAEAKPTARRDLLPDVEEINSTLRPSENASEEDTAGGEAGGAASEARSGFRSGFLLVVALSILGAAVYIGAASLSATFPTLAEPLTAYVNAIDGLRLQLDALMRSATVAINGE